jgi:hypothetical protein
VDKVPLSRIPSYIAKGRAGYVLQRGVPKALQPIIGKTLFKEPGGKTLIEARARVASFIERTDREIAIAKGEVKLSTAEVIERLTYEPDPEVQDAYATGAELDPELVPSMKARVVAIVTGEASPEPFYGPSDLLAIATSLKSPAARTEASWRKEHTSLNVLVLIQPKRN